MIVFIYGKFFLASAMAFLKILIFIQLYEIYLNICRFFYLYGGSGVMVAQETVDLLARVQFSAIALFT